MQTPILEQLVGPELFRQLADDPVAFVRAFDREPWPFQADILRRALAKDEDGRFAHRFVVISMPRQNGKTTLSAWIGLHRLFCDSDPQMILSIANDTDQARIILGDDTRIIRKSNVLTDCLREKWGIVRNEISLKDDRTWRIKSAQHVSTRGLRPSVVLYDELGWARDAELWEAVSAAQAAQVNPLLLVTTTVGPIKDGPLWSLFESARDGDPDILLLYFQDNLSPLVTEEYLVGQKANLPGIVYAREHENTWGEGGETFCTEDDWQSAISEGDPRRSVFEGPSVMFVDLGWIRNETAIAVATRFGDDVHIIALEGYRGKPSEPLNMPMIRDTITDMYHRLGVQRVEIESPQGVMMAQELDLSGLQCEVVYPTAQSQVNRWGALYTALKAKSVRLPDDDLLRRQLITLQIKQSLSGWRVVDVPAIHQDRAIAIAGAIYLLGEESEFSMADLDPAHALRSFSKWDSQKAMQPLAEKGESWIYRPGLGGWSRKEKKEDKGWGAGRISR